MDFCELVKLRHSVRSYKSDPIEDFKLQRVLEAAQLAPTAANRQPIQFIVIHTKGREEELSRIYGRDWFVQPPLIICACAVPSESWSRSDGKNYADVDTTIAMDHLILAATAEGLGTCWIAAFNPDAAREILGLPDNIEPVAFTPLGYPGDEPLRERKRKSISELVRYEKW